MIKTSYKTRQQELLISYLKDIQGKHFTAEDVRAHFAKKNLSIGIATIYRQLEKLVTEGKIQKYFIDEHSAACFEYTGEELSELGNHLQNEHGFALNPFRTVFYGICSDCRKKA